jgi:hypothetical protein
VYGNFSLLEQLVSEPMATTPIIHIASDGLADGLREALVQHIQASHPSFVVKDHGAHGKYYEIALKVGCTLKA